MRDNIKLPVGWDLATLSDVGEIVSGGTPSTTVSEYWNGDINWISPVDLSGYAGKYISKGKKSITVLGLQKSSAKLMPKGSVLFSSRAPIGYVAIAADELSTNQGFKSIIPGKSIFNEYLYYFLKFAKKQAEDLASGTTFKEISLTNFAKIQIPLPPLAEQHRIVAKIEELFSNLDKGIERLKAAQQQLKIYRQSVLKWAFEGKLTSRSTREGSSIEFWRFFKLAEITLKIQIGPFGTQLHREDYVENGIPLINPMHIQNGQIIPDVKYTITQKKKETLAEYILRKGDIILGRRGEMGRCALVQTKESGWLCGTGSLYIRPSLEMLNSKFLYYFLNSETAKKYLEENAAGTTMANLNSKIIRCLPIKLPPLNEQQKIVTEIESRLSICDKMEEIIAQNLLQTKALQQSILKQAFEGKLVPQDPKDVPTTSCWDKLDWIK